MADWDCAEFLEDWEKTSDGLERLLGAPLGKKEFCAKKAEKIVKDLLKGLSNLKELDMAQLEFFILKHTDCMKVTHLTRLLPPSVLDGALKMFDQKIRAELDVGVYVLDPSLTLTRPSLRCSSVRSTAVWVLEGMRLEV